MSDLKELYPIFVSQSRYSGLYEGGSWYALPKADAAWAWSDSFTEYAFGDDDAAVTLAVAAALLSIFGIQMSQKWSEGETLQIRQFWI